MDEVYVRIDAEMIFDDDEGGVVAIENMPIVIPVNSYDWDRMSGDEREGAADEVFWEHCRTILSNVRVFGNNEDTLCMDIEFAIIENPDDDTSILASHKMEDVLFLVRDGAKGWEKDEDRLQSLVWEKCYTNIERMFE